MVPRSLQAILDNVALLRATIREPTTKREDADLESCGTQVAELHVLGIESGLDRHRGDELSSNYLW
jgi:hypothetical protein